MLDFSVTFAVTIVNITVLYFILRKILFKPVTKFMAERTARIENSIAQAEQDRTQAKALLAQCEERLKKADAEADGIIRAAKERAEAEAEKILAGARLSAEAEADGARARFQTEQAAALALFREDAAALVILAAGRLAGREFRSEDNARYADMLLDEAAREGGFLSRGAVNP